MQKSSSMHQVIKSSRTAMCKVIKYENVSCREVLVKRAPETDFECVGVWWGGEQGAREDEAVDESREIRKRLAYKRR